MQGTKRTLKSETTCWFKRSLVSGPLAATLVALPIAIGMVGCKEKSIPQQPQVTAKQAKAATSSPSASAAVTQSDAGVELLAGYSLNQPDEAQDLPMELAEVSGITYVTNSEIACVQDEEGVVFIYDLKARSILKRIPFGPRADYEGLTRVDNSLFVLQSNGTLIEIAEYATAPKVTREKLGIPTNDNEGLCYDPTLSRLLIAPKSRLNKDSEEKQTQPLYAYDLRERKFVSEPAVMLELSGLDEPSEDAPVAVEKKGKKGKKSKKAKHAKPIKTAYDKFFPSAVAVHPTTGDIFVLSAEDRRLVVVNRQGQLRGHVLLDKVLYRQPESMTFLPNGELIIANEASGAKPTLYRLVPKAAKAN